MLANFQVQLDVLCPTMYEQNNIHYLISEPYQRVQNENKRISKL